MLVRTICFALVICSSVAFATETLINKDRSNAPLFPVSNTESTAIPAKDQLARDDQAHNWISSRLANTGMNACTRVNAMCPWMAEESR